MTDETSPWGPADFNEERDEAIERHFPYWRQISPEEYAAHNAHLIGSYSYHLYMFSNPEIGAWARRLGEILTNGNEMDRCCREHLTPEEFWQVQTSIDEIRKYGL